MNNEIKWKNENLFKFKSDITRTIYYKVCSSLDECFLNEHIGGLVGTYLFDDIALMKENSEILE